MAEDKLSRAIVIAGVTAAGKSQIAVEVAKKIGGEVVSADAMQVYAGLDFLTFAPSKEDMQGIPHHLVGFCPVGGEYSAARFVKDAKRCIDEIIARDKTPIIAGGSGMYISRLLYGIFEGGQVDQAYRARLLEEGASEEGRKRLYKRLLAVDPVYANKTHPNDLKRIARALEVFEATGLPFSAHHNATKGGIADRFAIVRFFLDRRRDDLLKRVSARIAGLTEEHAKTVYDLCRSGISKTARAVIGVNEMLAAAQGKIPLEDAKAAIIKRTMQYARRQRIWFRKDKSFEWLMLEKDAGPAEAINSILGCFYGKS